MSKHAARPRVMKSTNRPQDYAIISRLAMLRIANDDKPRRSLLRWAAANAFRVEDLADLVNRFGDWLEPGDGAAPQATRRLPALRSKGIEISAADIAFAEGELLRAMTRFIVAGRAYWIPRLHDLRRLRTTGRLWPEGTPVVDLIAR